MVAQAPQWLIDSTWEADDDELRIKRHIRPHPHEYGRAYAVVYPNGPSVAAVVRTLTSNNGDIADAARIWNTTEEEVSAAVAFYRRYHEYIAARILLEDDQSDLDLRAEFGVLPWQMSS